MTHTQSDRRHRDKQTNNRASVMFTQNTSLCSMDRRHTLTKVKEILSNSFVFLGSFFFSLRRSRIRFFSSPVTALRTCLAITLRWGLKRSLGFLMRCWAFALTAFTFSAIKFSIRFMLWQDYDWFTMLKWAQTLMCAVSQLYKLLLHTQQTEIES